MNIHKVLLHLKKLGEAMDKAGSMEGAIDKVEEFGHPEVARKMREMAAKGDLKESDVIEVKKKK